MLQEESKINHTCFVLNTSMFGFQSGWSSQPPILFVAAVPHKSDLQFANIRDTKYQAGLCLAMSKWENIAIFPTKWRANEQQGGG